MESFGVDRRNFLRNSRISYHLTQCVCEHKFWIDSIENTNWSENLIGSARRMAFPVSRYYEWQAHKLATARCMRRLFFFLLAIFLITFLITSFAVLNSVSCSTSCTYECAHAIRGACDRLDIRRKLFSRPLFKWREEEDEVRTCCQCHHHLACCSELLIKCLALWTRVQW